MKGNNDAQDLNSYGFKLIRDHRYKVADICMQTGMSVNAVVNACIGYGLEHLTVKPVTRLGLVFDGKEEEE